MPYINRVVYDVVSDEPMSESRSGRLGEETQQWAHVIGVDAEDGVILVDERYVSVHVHDATEGKCRVCYYHANDEKNGDVVT